MLLAILCSYRMRGALSIGVDCAIGHFLCLLVSVMVVNGMSFADDICEVCLRVSIVNVASSTFVGM